MYCQNCGNEIAENINYCPHCGYLIYSSSMNRQYQGLAPYDYRMIKPLKSHWFLRFLMIFSCICAVLSLVAWLWVLPMTAYLFDKMGRGERVSGAFKVCTLLFVSLLAGVILICSDDL